ncbi:MAG: DUF2019 domain-containing protein [Terricaulis sp.]
MTAAQWNGMSEEELIQAYHDSAKRHGEATKNGDPEAANSAAKSVTAIYGELRRRGRSTQDKLLPLLFDAEPSVRLWSASHVLEFAPSEGEAVLSKLSESASLLGLDAEVTLEEWRAGRLQFP